MGAVALTRTRSVVVLALVGGGAVGGGNGDVVEPEVDAELGAVVDDVVEEHGTDGIVAGAVVDRVAVVGELPGLMHGAVGCVFEESVGFGAELVEGCQKLGAGLHDERLVGGLGEVKVRRAEDDGEHARHLRGVGGELGEGCGLLVGLEVVFVEGVGNALEDDAGLAEFGVEFGEEKVLDGHGAPCWCVAIEGRKVRPRIARRNTDHTH